MNMEGLFDLKIAEIAFQEMLKDWGISEDDCLDLLTSKWQTSEKELGFDLANDPLSKHTAFAGCSGEKWFGKNLMKNF